MTDYFFHCITFHSLLHVSDIRRWLDEHVTSHEEDVVPVPNFEERLAKSYQSDSFKEVLENKLSGWNKFPETAEGIKNNSVRSHLQVAYLLNPYIKKQDFN